MEPVLAAHILGQTEHPDIKEIQDINTKHGLDGTDSVEEIKTSQAEESELWKTCILGLCNFKECRLCHRVPLRQTDFPEDTFAAVIFLGGGHRGRV